MPSDTMIAVEVRAAFEAYERALLTNDVEVLNAWFRPGRATTRFGLDDVERGWEEIAAWRRRAEPVPATRRLGRIDVLVLGPDAAVVACEFGNLTDPDGPVGRQSQVWSRTSNGWRIVHAHVSLPTSAT
jgi:ketosteroid isomerase-like protein